MHLRARRMLLLGTHLPATRVQPGPQPKATCVTRGSGRDIGPGVTACAEVATTKASPAAVINLIILRLLTVVQMVIEHRVGDAVPVSLAAVRETSRS